MKLTKEQKERVAVLKDVLKHIEANRIVGERGCVIRYSTDEDIKEKDLQKVLKSFSRKKEQCNVCIRGGILFASVWKNNNLKVDWTYQGGGVKNHLLGTAGQNDIRSHDKYINELFPIRDQQLMERAFEGRFHTDVLTTKELNKCDEYYIKWGNPTTRIKKIVNNAIKNNGTFIP